MMPLPYVIAIVALALVAVLAGMLTAFGPVLAKRRAEPAPTKCPWLTHEEVDEMFRQRDLRPAPWITEGDVRSLMTAEMLGTFAKFRETLPAVIAEEIERAGKRPAPWVTREDVVAWHNSLPPGLSIADVQFHIESALKEHAAAGHVSTASIHEALAEIEDALTKHATSAPHLTMNAVVTAAMMQAKEEYVPRNEVRLYIADQLRAVIPGEEMRARLVVVVREELARMRRERRAAAAVVVSRPKAAQRGRRR